MRVQMVKNFDVAGGVSRSIGDVVDLADHVAVVWIRDGLAVPYRVEQMEVAAEVKMRRRGHVTVA